MIFHETTVVGAYLIELERLEDDRGFFARTFDERVFSEMGVANAVVQTNISHTSRQGTLRGMHFQTAPHEEAKLVRCVRGSIYDVVMDTRPNSVTFGKWFGTFLTYENGLALYAPPGTAHGFITLEDDCDVLYQMSAAFVAEAVSGIRWDDPFFHVQWPITPKLISEKDRTLPTITL